MKTTLIATFALLSLGMMGCSGGAQLVRHDAGTGLIALEGAYVPSMQEARMLMLETCEGRFDAEEKGDHVVFRCQNSAPIERRIEVASLQLAGSGL